MSAVRRNDDSEGDSTVQGITVHSQVYKVEPMDLRLVAALRPILAMIFQFKLAVIIS